MRADEHGADVSIVHLDLASLASVRACAEILRSNNPTIDLLVNNAGVMAVDWGRTGDGFETQIGVNYLGHFALTALLLPPLRSTTGSRVAMMSSNGHRAGRIRLDDLNYCNRAYQRWRAYYQSKLAVQLFAYELSRRLGAVDSGPLVISAHPGAARTTLAGRVKP
jgi:NAD(P)-dependent dehydrogenase (short-subunit alcohol dehydrogenase family)